MGTGISTAIHPVLLRLFRDLERAPEVYSIHVMVPSYSGRNTLPAGPR
jgi:hypothetical protein